MLITIIIFMTLFVIVFYASKLIISRSMPMKRREEDNLLVGPLVNAFSASIIFSVAYISVIINLELVLFTEDDLIWEIDDTREIASILCDSSLEGRFFLGTGVINERRYYLFYQRSDVLENEVVWERGRVDEYRAFIIESNDSEPRIEYQSGSYPNDYSLWVFPVFFTSTHRRVFIYVPEGTIIREFELR